MIESYLSLTGHWKLETLTKVNTFGIKGIRFWDAHSIFRRLKINVKKM